MTASYLDALVAWARRLPPMTAAERDAQRISFVYGNVAIDNPAVTSDMVTAQNTAAARGPHAGQAAGEREGGNHPDAIPPAADYKALCERLNAVKRSEYIGTNADLCWEAAAAIRDLEGRLRETQQNAADSDFFHKLYKEKFADNTTPNPPAADIYSPLVHHIFRSGDPTVVRTEHGLAMNDVAPRDLSAEAAAGMVAGPHAAAADYTELRADLLALQPRLLSFDAVVTVTKAADAIRDLEGQRDTLRNHVMNADASLTKMHAIRDALSAQLATARKALEEIRNHKGASKWEAHIDRAEMKYIAIDALVSLDAEPANKPCGLPVVAASTALADIAAERQRQMELLYANFALVCGKTTHTAVWTRGEKTTPVAANG